jgi:transposase
MLFIEREGDSMPKIKYHVCLSANEKTKLQNLVSKGTSTAKMIMHANILLAADENNIHRRKSEAEIAELFHVSRQTVHSVRQQYSEKGLTAAIGRKKRDIPPVPAKITGDVEARIIALSCNEPPEGRSKWTLRLLADKAVELEILDSISYVSIGQVLKKTNSNHI